MTRVFLFCTLAIGLGAIACRNNNYEATKLEYAQKQKDQGGAISLDTSQVMSFQRDILPIMQSQCGAGDNNCHTAEAVAGGLTSVYLYDYVGVSQAQVPDGLFYSSIIWDGNATKMPRKSKTQIDPLYIGAIKKWIDNGMLNN